MIKFEEFDVLKELGKGKYGKVVKVQRNKTKDLFALKLIKINKSLSKKEQDNLYSECEIFKTISNHFVVKAFYW